MRYVEKEPNKIVEAFMWTGGPDQKEDPVWIIDAIKNGKVKFLNSGTPEVQMIIDESSTPLVFRANPGDYIIKEGDYIRVLAPEVFNIIYQPFV